MTTTRHQAQQAAYSVTKDELKAWIDGYSNGDEDYAAEVAAKLYDISCDVANHPEGASAQAITFFYRWGSLGELKAKAEQRGESPDLGDLGHWDDLIWSAWVDLSAALAEG